MGFTPADLIAQLQRTGFRDIAGAHVSAHIPVLRALVNQIVAQALPAGGVIRRLEIRPRADDRFDVVVTTTWSLVPPLTVGVTIERQPEFPSSPLLVLRWSVAPGLDAIASQFVGAFNQRMPPGIRLERDRILIDVPAVALNTAAAAVMPFVAALRVHAAEERLMLDVELRAASVGPAAP
jgi:hypothetical protein